MGNTFQREIGVSAPVYERVADKVREEILSGVYASREKLPPVDRLRGRYGVSLVTMQRALAILDRQGLLTRTPGRGTFVTNVKLGRARPTIGVTFPGLRLPIDELTEQSAPTYFRFFHGFAMAAQSLNVDLRIFPAQTLTAATVRELDGLVLGFATQESNAVLDLATKLSCPVIVANLFMPEWREKLYSVNIDYRAGGRLIVERLMKEKRKKTIFFCSYEARNDWHAWWLTEGFRDAAERLGLPVQWELNPLTQNEQLNPAITRITVEKALRRTNDFDAVVTTDFREALAVRFWSEKRPKISAEHYLLITPKIHHHEVIFPGTLTLDIPMWELGVATMKTMIALLNGQAPSRDGVWLAPALSSDVPTVINAHSMEAFV